MENSSDSTPSSGLRERRRQQTQREIADAAIELFSRAGVEQTTVDELAEAAGISPRTFFRYAPTKEHAIFAADRGAEELFAALHSDPRPDESPVGAIEHAHAKLLRAFDEQTTAEHQREFRARELVLSNERLLALALAREADIFERLVAFVRDHDSSGLTDLQIRAHVTTVGTILRMTFDEWARLVARGERPRTTALYLQIRQAMATSLERS